MKLHARASPEGLLPLAGPGRSGIRGPEGRRLTDFEILTERGAWDQACGIDKIAAEVCALQAGRFMCLETGERPQEPVRSDLLPYTAFRSQLRPGVPAHMPHPHHPDARARATPGATAPHKGILGPAGTGRIGTLSVIRTSGKRAGKTAPFRVVLEACGKNNSQGLKVLISGGVFAIIN